MTRKSGYGIVMKNGLSKSFGTRVVRTNCSTGSQSRRTHKMDKAKAIRIAYFISAHGFGHAARACAVMEALHKARPSVHFDVFTRVPRWFFEGSLEGTFTYHSVLTDVGVVQTNALTEDLEKTIAHLDAFYPLNPALISGLARDVVRRNCRLVLCDISPLGIAVARRAGIPSVLIENFTWDWIYAGYARIEPRIARHVDYLSGVFASADHHIQTEPVCSRCPANLVTLPFGRRQRQSRETTRERFGIQPDEKTVIITMGGFREDHSFLDKLKQRKTIHFLIPGITKELVKEDNLTLIPFHSDYHHPDLVHASDAVIGKVGYGIIAETYEAGIPFGFIPRTGSPESEVLATFVRREMPGLPITEVEFRNGDWTARLDELLQIPKAGRKMHDAASRITEYILALAP